MALEEAVGVALMERAEDLETRPGIHTNSN